MHKSTTTVHSANLITDFVTRLGFDRESAAIYLVLIQKGPQTLLEVSRNSGIERTKIYRIIDSLINKGLIERIPAYKRLTIQATGLNTLEMLVEEKERESKQLLENIPFITEAFNVLSQKTDDNQVIYYRGIEGIRTMTWHTLDCIGTYRAYSYRYWDDILGTKFMVKMSEELSLRDLKIHDLYSDQYFDYKKWWYASGHKKPAGTWKNWESRFISEKILKVDWNLDVYNDVVAYYYWQGEETFGVEIHNPRFALFQKQVHDILWKMARKRSEIGWTQPNKGVFDTSI